MLGVGDIIKVTKQQPSIGSGISLTFSRREKMKKTEIFFERCTLHEGVRYMKVYVA